MDKSEKKQFIYNKFLKELDDIQPDHWLATEKGQDIDILRENKVKQLDPEKNYTTFLIDLFGEDELYEVGLIDQTEGYKYCPFNKCSLLIPFFVDGKIEHLQARTLDKKNAYKNLAGTIKTPLYIPNLSGMKKLYVCEGALTALAASVSFDAIGLLNAGVGKQENLKEEIKRIFRLYRDREIIFMPDIDVNGIEACFSIMAILDEIKINYNPTFFNVRHEAVKHGFDKEDASELKDYNDFTIAFKAISGGEQQCTTTKNYTLK